MKHRLRPILAPAFALIFAFASPAARGDTGTPRALIESFHDTLLVVMREGPTLDFDGRYRRLLPAVERTFHLPVMIQVATGSAAWNRASAAQQKDLVAAWTGFSTGTYAKNFKSHGGERFETVGERPGPQATTLVDTRLIKSDGSGVDITYVLKSSPEGWKVVDVIVDKGISELALRRSEFSREVKDGGVDALVATLTRKAAELAAQSP